MKLPSRRTRRADAPSRLTIEIGYVTRESGVPADIPIAYLPEGASSADWDFAQRWLDAWRYDPPGVF